MKKNNKKTEKLLKYFKIKKNKNLLMNSEMESFLLALTRGPVILLFSMRG